MISSHSLKSSTSSRSFRSCVVGPLPSRARRPGGHSRARASRRSPHPPARDPTLQRVPLPRMRCGPVPWIRCRQCRRSPESRNERPPEPFARLSPREYSQPGPCSPAPPSERPAPPAARLPQHRHTAPPDASTPTYGVKAVSSTERGGSTVWSIPPKICDGMLQDRACRSRHRGLVGQVQADSSMMDCAVCVRTSA